MARVFPIFDCRATHDGGLRPLCRDYSVSPPPALAHPRHQATAKKALSGTDEQIFLGDSIKKNYDPNVIMKRGEAFFEKEEYAEAIVEYNHFLDLHRTHILASYATFRIGESQMKLTKGIQRDPGPIQKAIEAFERLRKDFPGSRYDGPALQKIQECHDLLAQMHLFVGNSIIGGAHIWPPHIASNKS